MKIFLIHGAFGNPNENWFPWLKQKLEESNFEVIVPHFPTPENQNLENWMEVFENYLPLDENAIFVGHSLGCAFILSLLEKHKAKAAFLVAGFIERLGLKEFDLINLTFTEKEFDFEKIRQNCKNVFLFNSLNDPYVPFEKARQLEKLLDAELLVEKEAGHFNKGSGFEKFEKLLGEILKL